MTKKLIMLVSICLLTTTCLFGCGNDPKKSDDNATTAAKVEVTTKEDGATTEATTTEPTTEEKTTVHVKQGISVGVEKKNADKFKGLVIESGHVFYINDFCSIENSDEDSFRGDTAFAIMTHIGMDTTEFLSKYFPAGAQAPKIPYSDNYSFTYNGDKKFVFTFMKERANGFVYFDLHEVK
ncbi:MAG: hypothetical protein UF228_11175 [Lachnospiraceae bacterium]|nr:hypothetical protein [Lachnospiraceae bacterium]